MVLTERHLGSGNEIVFTAYRTAVVFMAPYGRERLLALRNGPLLYISNDFGITTAHCLETCLTMASANIDLM